jgi:hypothetical protein
MILQMQDLASYISFGDAQKRYDIKHPALSYRIKALGLQTKRKGRNTYLTIKQISLLDDLNRFLSDNPNKSINQFMSLQKDNLQFKPDNVTISNASVADELNTFDSDTDETLTRHCDTDPSLTSPNIPQIKSQITHILKAISRIEGCEDFVSQALTNLTSQEQIRAKDKEIAELKKEINKLTVEFEKSNSLIKNLHEAVVKGVDNIDFLRVELDFKKQECVEWEEVWIKLVPYESIHCLFSKIDGRVYLKKNQFDFEYSKRILERVFSLFNR